MLVIYNILFPFLFALYSPLFVLKLVRRRGFSHHLWERFGFFSRQQQATLRTLDRPVWIHAVSVGEVVAACGFIQRWRKREPDTRFVLSTTTTTGHATAARKLPDGVALIYCPLDFWLCVGRALRLIAPRMLVIFEVELWPNLISMAAGRGIAVALVNGRVSDHSATGYARHAWFFKGMFAQIDAFCMQSEADAERVRAVCGATAPVHVCNTMKFDQVPDTNGADCADLLDEVFGTDLRLVWTAGSTHAGEEALVADVFRAVKADCPALKLVLVPRHHERSAEVERALVAHQLSYRLLEQPGDAPACSREPVDVLLVNTTGELMAFYGACDFAFVGKSLAGNHGGHNIIEPAIFAKPIVHGSNMENFRLVAQVFRTCSAALEVQRDDQLERAVRQLCTDSELRKHLGGKARSVVDRQRGAMDRTIDILSGLAPASAPGAR